MKFRRVIFRDHKKVTREEKIRITKTKNQGRERIA